MSIYTSFCGNIHGIFCFTVSLFGDIIVIFEWRSRGADPGTVQRGVYIMNAQTDRRETFFTHDIDFYRNFFRLMAVVALQNLVAYSVNMADNIMLGRYSQTALSGAATVNQIFFLVQQTTLTIGDALVILASQYWGQNRTQPIRKLTGVALKLGMVCGLLILAVCFFFPGRVLGIFTSDAAIISAGRRANGKVQAGTVVG